MPSAPALFRILDPYISIYREPILSIYRVTGALLCLTHWYLFKKKNNNGEMSRYFEKLVFSYLL